MKCPDCNNTGFVTGFTTRRRCARCLVALADSLINRVIAMRDDPRYAPWVYLPLWTDKTKPPPAWNTADVAKSLGYDPAQFAVACMRAMRAVDMATA